MPKKKQAVVLIHGVGDQLPMETLRGFADTVWTHDPTVPLPKVPPRMWSKPDNISDNLELRRLTTTVNRNRLRTDFFEFHWAEHMADNKLGHVWAWLRGLLFRPPWRLPSQLRLTWLLLVALGLLIAWVWLHPAAVFLGWIESPTGKLQTFLSIARFAAPVVWFLLSGFLVAYAGDAARYLHPAPANIAARRAIRAAGLALLKKLHDDDEYARIILIGHSLGTVIGYDLLTHAWPRYCPQIPVIAELETLEKMAADPARFDPTAYQAAQRAYQQKADAKFWKITDFITLGSPLAHATVLMARNATDLGEKQKQREYPTCPPVTETLDSVERFSYEASGGRELHHAAVFAAVRWTNVYFPCHLTFWGDLIAGPVAPVFGRGVRDIRTWTWLNCGLFTHTCYWIFKPGKPKPPASAESGEVAPPSAVAVPAHIRELRAAVALVL